MSLWSGLLARFQEFPSSSTISRIPAARPPNGSRYSFASSKSPTIAVPDTVSPEAMRSRRSMIWGGLPTLATMRKAEARPDASAFQRLRDPVIRRDTSGRLSAKAVLPGQTTGWRVLHLSTCKKFGPVDEPVAFHQGAGRQTERRPICRTVRPVRDQARVGEGSKGHRSDGGEHRDCRRKDVAVQCVKCGRRPGSSDNRASEAGLPRPAYRVYHSSPPPFDRIGCVQHLVESILSPKVQLTRPAVWPYDTAPSVIRSIPSSRSTSEDSRSEKTPDFRLTGDVVNREGFASRRMLPRSVDGEQQNAVR